MRFGTDIFFLLVAGWLFATPLLLPGIARAQQGTGDLSEQSTTGAAVLDELLITDNEEPLPRTGEVIEDEHTGSRSRISTIRLEQPGAQLGELLGSTSGIQQRQTGGFGTFSSITVRAASAAQTAVYLDGILLNSGGEPVIDLSTLEILNLSSVDLYRGSAPLQLGHASMGGAVNLNTGDANDRVGSRIRLGVGSFSHAALLAGTQGRANKWDWTGSVAHQRSDNNFTFINDNATPLNPNDDERQQRINSQVRRSSILLKSGYQASDNLRTDVLLQVAGRQVGVPDVRNTLNNRARYDTLKSQLQLSQRVDQWHGWNTRHSLYWHQADSVYDDSLSQIGLGAQLIDSDINTVGASTYWERFVDLGTFGLSADLRHETLGLVDELNDAENFTSDRQLLVTAMHLAIIDANDRWMLTPALRWQGSVRNGTSTAIGVPTDQPERTESELGAQLGASYAVTPTITLSANAGNTFREPAFGELFGSLGLINGVPTLEPERGTNMDIGVGYQVNSLELQAVVFQNRSDELIITTYDARGVGRPFNTGKAEVTGLELEASWQPLPTWRLNANTTLQNARNRNPFSGFENKQLPGEARSTAFARISFKPGPTSYWYEWRASRDRFYDSANLLRAENTSLHSIGLDMKHKRWHVSAKIQNVTDTLVEDFNGFPKPGKQFAVAVSYTL